MYGLLKAMGDCVEANFKENGTLLPCCLTLFLTEWRLDSEKCIESQCKECGHVFRFVVRMPLLDVMLEDPALGCSLLAFSLHEKERASVDGSSSDSVEVCCAVAFAVWWTEAADAYLSYICSSEGSDAMSWTHRFFSMFTDLSVLQRWVSLVNSWIVAPSNTSSYRSFECRLQLSQTPSCTTQTGDFVLHSRVELEAVISQLYFASRSDVEPLQWLRLKPIRAMGGDRVPSLTSEVLCVSRSSLPKELRIGSIVNLSGEVRRTSVLDGRAPVSKRPGVPCRVRDPLTAAGGQVYIVVDHLYCTARPIRAPSYLSVPSDDEENDAAVFSTRMWMGFRFAAGVRLHHQPSHNMRLTAFAGASLDALLSLLLAMLRSQYNGALYSEQTDDRLPEKLSHPDRLCVCMIDDGGTVPESLDVLLSDVSSSLAVVLSPSQTRKLKKKDYLPSYHTHSTRTSIFPRTVGLSPADTNSTEILGLESKCIEKLQAGVLNECSCATLVLESAELASNDVLRMLQSSLGQGSSSSTHGSGGEPDLSDDLSSMAIDRDGGQSCPYQVSSAFLLCVSDGSQVSRNQSLFAMTERADVVVRPCVSSLRTWWSGYCSNTAAVSDRETVWKEAVKWKALFSKVVTSLRSSPSQLESQLSSGAPAISEKCALLLRMYFLAAKRIFGAAVDSTVLPKLIKITLAHTLIRASACDAWSGSISPVSYVSLLIDALVAIALADATLHFMTGKTVLGQCLLSTLEGELSDADLNGEHTSSSTIITITSELVAHFSSLLGDD